MIITLNKIKDYATLSSRRLFLNIFYEMYRYLPTGPNKFKVVKTFKIIKEMCASSQIKQQLLFQIKLGIQC